jgi:hypothetical protein
MIDGALRGANETRDAVPIAYLDQCLSLLQRNPAE